MAEKKPVEIYICNGKNIWSTVQKMMAEAYLDFFNKKSKKIFVLSVSYSHKSNINFENCILSLCTSCFIWSQQEKQHILHNISLVVAVMVVVVEKKAEFLAIKICVMHKVIVALAKADATNLWPEN